MNIRKFFKKESPFFLTCIGGIGVIATAVLTARATPKAIDLIEREKRERITDENECIALTNAEMVAIAWKPYIPAIAMGMATMGCIFGANILNKKQQATIAGAYIFLDRSYKEYKRKMIELYGEDADKNVREAVVKEKYDQSTPDRPSNPDGETLLFFEEHYGQYFERKMVEVIDAEYQLNRKLSKEGEVSLNDFFEFLGLDHQKIGDALGWSREIICDFYNPTWIDFEHQLVTMDDGMECYIINMSINPIFDYDLPF